MKDVEPQKLIETIHNVLDGKRIIHPDAKHVLDSMSSKPHFTNKLSKEKQKYLKKWSKERPIKKLLIRYLYLKNN